jgi:hypothetical protein
MGCFPKPYDVPDQVVEFVRRAVEPPENTLPVAAVPSRSPGTAAVRAVHGASAIDITIRCYRETRRQFLVVPR